MIKLQDQRLPSITAGATMRPMEIHWQDSNGNPRDLSNTTITARIQDRDTGDARSAVGTFLILDAPGGVFAWTLDTADAVAGDYNVQFVATGNAGALDITMSARWIVREAI